MFGAPSGGFGASGHQGFDSATVLPTVPQNGVPLPALWERAGFSPTEIERFDKLRAEEAKYADPAPALVETPPAGVKPAPGDPAAQ